eukprot:jgi/Orpsp1_1/1189601/evm.model.d7180000073179.1
MKNSVLFSLIAIKRQHYYELDNFKSDSFTPLDRFELLCSNYDLEELKQLRRARELRNILHITDYEYELHPNVVNVLNYSI